MIGSSLRRLYPSISKLLETPPLARLGYEIECQPRNPILLFILLRVSKPCFLLDGGGIVSGKVLYTSTRCAIIDPPISFARTCSCSISIRQRFRDMTKGITCIMGSTSQSRDHLDFRTEFLFRRIAILFLCKSYIFPPYRSNTLRYVWRE